MKRKLKIAALFTVILVGLCSCLIVIDDLEPGSDTPGTDKVSFTNVFKGPVGPAGNPTSYQFMCYVKNNTGRTLENVNLEVDWWDQVGNRVAWDLVTIKRLEPWEKWPVGVIRTSPYDLIQLKNSTATIRYLSSSSSSSNYITNIEVYDTTITRNYNSPTYISGHFRNPNLFNVKILKVFAVSLDSAGKIVEYGEKDINLVIVNTGSFTMTLNEPAGTPATNKTYFFVVGKEY